MKKETYVAPTIEVVEMENESVMAQSPTRKGNKPGSMPYGLSQGTEDPLKPFDLFDQQDDFFTQS